MMINLSSLNSGESAVTRFIKKDAPLRRRLFDLGIVNGTTVKCLQKSFFGDPAAYLIRDTVIAIRNDDAKYIMID